VRFAHKSVGAVFGLTLANGGVPSLVSVIALEFDDDGYRADLASVVGPRSDAALAVWIADLCRVQLAQVAVDARFAHKSVGAVFGLTLRNGDGVVLKLFPSSFDEAALRAIERCHADIVDAGFPAPRQRIPMFRADGVWGAFYELIEGDRLDAHQPEVRRILAEALAALAGVTSRLDATGLLLSPARGATLWGTPHRLGMNLALAGGEWIDARGEAARRTIQEAALPLGAAHLDWGTKNAVFRGGRLHAMLDWDSLMQASEAEMVGRAAAQFTAQWDFPARLTPTPNEATAFVREYEQARGRRFGPLEQRVVNASADYLMAQVARQEHGAPVRDDDYRSLLRETAITPLVAF
jgi:hypothetical protein